MTFNDLKNLCGNIELEVNTRDVDIYFYDDDEDVYKKITSTYFFKNGNYSKRNKVVVHLERDFAAEEGGEVTC